MSERKFVHEPHVSRKGMTILATALPSLTSADDLFRFPKTTPTAPRAGHSFPSLAPPRLTAHEQHRAPGRNVYPLKRDQDRTWARDGASTAAGQSRQQITKKCCSHSARQLWLTKQ